MLLGCLPAVGLDRACRLSTAATTVGGRAGARQRHGEGRLTERTLSLSHSCVPHRLRVHGALVQVDVIMLVLAAVVRTRLLLIDES